MDESRSAHIAIRRGRGRRGGGYGGVRYSPPVARTTVGHRGRPRVTRVSENVPAPPAITVSAPELAPEEESIHSGSEPRVSAGAEIAFVVPPVPTTVDAIHLAAALLAQSIRATLDAEGVQTTAAGGEPTGLTVQRELARTLRLFFAGGTYFMAADRWVIDMEHQFSFMGVTDTYMMARVAPVTFQDEVVSWWKATKAMLGDAELTWGELAHMFLERYFPDTKRDRIRDEFTSLT